MVTLSLRIKAVRTAVKMTQDDFSAALGVHKNTLRRWERGEGVPDAEAVSKICQQFGVSPYWLLNGVEPMYDKDREVTLEVKPRMKAGDLRGHKLSEVRGGAAFDTAAARLQGRLQEIAKSLPEDSEDADLEKALLYQRIEQLEEQLRLKTEIIAAKDQTIEALKPTTVKPEMTKEKRAIDEEPPTHMMQMITPESIRESLKKDK